MMRLSRAFAADASLSAACAERMLFLFEGRTQLQRMLLLRAWSPLLLLSTKADSPGHPHD